MYRELWKNTDAQVLTPRKFHVIALGWVLRTDCVCVCVCVNISFSVYSNVQPELRTAGLRGKVSLLEAGIFSLFRLSNVMGRQCKISCAERDFKTLGTHDKVSHDLFPL